MGRAARGMRADPGGEPGKAVAERLPQLLDEAGLARERSLNAAVALAGLDVPLGTLTLPVSVAMGPFPLPQCGRGCRAEQGG
jgi:hypothetical protein